MRTWRAIRSNRAMWAVHVAAFVMWLWTPWCGGLPRTTDSTVYNCTWNFFFFLFLFFFFFFFFSFSFFNPFPDMPWGHCMTSLTELFPRFLCDGVRHPASVAIFCVSTMWNKKKCLNLMFLVFWDSICHHSWRNYNRQSKFPGRERVTTSSPRGLFFILFFYLLLLLFIFSFLLHSLLFMPLELFPLGPLSTGRSYRESAWRQSVCGRVMLNPGRCCFDRLFKSISAPPVPAFSAGVCEWAWRKGN